MSLQMANAVKNRAAVIGWPVSHSLSPRLHKYWLGNYNIEGEYTALPVKPEALAVAVNTLKDEGWKGFNLTLPHKEKILPFLDEIDPMAERIGAVNTVINKAGKLIGYNTDAYGFWENIKRQVKGKNKAVMLGAGGASRAVIEALLANGFTHITVTNRTLSRAENLCTNQNAVEIAAWEDRSLALTSADLLINTTSLGMVGKESLDMDLSLLPVAALVTDIVYTPLMTPLLEAAKARGNPVVDGLGMLLHQAVPAFEAWFGVRPEVTRELRLHMLHGITA